MKKDLESNFVSGNTIFIHDDFDQDISSMILPQFDSLIESEKVKKDGKIIIDIDSNGGYTRYLSSLLARVEKAKSENIIVETRVFACAHSCGSILACSGTKGSRFISRTAEHLCHLGSGGLQAHSDIELERQSERVKAHFDFVRSCYKQYANIPKLNQVIKDDCLYVRGQNIIDWGLADKFFY